MPVMNICEEDGTLGWWAPFVVNATRWYPRNEEMIASVVAAFELEYLQEQLGEESFIDEVTGNKELAELLQLSPNNLLQASSRLKVIQDALAPDAMFAGMILIYLICAKVHHPELDPKLATIIPTFAELLRSKGEARLTCERSLRRRWATYKPAVHLWSAWLVDSFNSDSAAYNPAEVLFERVDKLITLSEELRRMATRFRFLSPAETWRAPDNFVPLDITIEPPPLPDDFLDLLRKRKLRTSKRFVTEKAESEVEGSVSIRTMDICTSDGDLHELAPIVLNATIWYPKDEARRLEVIETMTIASLFANDEYKQALCTDEDLRREAIELAASVSLRHPLRSVLEAAHAHAEGAMAAGDILLYLICTSHHVTDRESSLAAVIDTLSRWDEYPCKTSYLERQWGAFKPAAHLWAATVLHLMNSTSDPESAANELSCMNPEGLRRFFTLAEQIREHGEEMRFLDPTECWRVPDEFVRSPDKFEPTFPPPAAFVELFRTYRPKYSKRPM